MKSIAIWCFVILCFSSCIGQDNPDVQLQNGDLLFVQSSGSALSEAIDDVTSDDELNFVHVALLALSDSDTTVIHADIDCGVCELPFEQWRNNYTSAQVYRIEGITNEKLDSAISIARRFIDQPYNFSYVISDTSKYCSELVYNAFEPWQLFSLEPMTFKNSNETAFNPTWVEYYKSLGMKVPEGRPGCNPNGLAQNEKLTYVGMLP